MSKARDIEFWPREHFLDTIMLNYSRFEWEYSKAVPGSQPNSEYRVFYKDWSLVVGFNTSNNQYFIIVSDKRRDKMETLYLPGQKYPIIKQIFESIQRWFENAKERDFWEYMNQNIDNYLKDKQS